MDVSALPLAGVGTILGSFVAAYICANSPSRRQFLVINALACALLGGLLGAPTPSLNYLLPVALGFLAATSPMTWVLLPWPGVHDRRDAVRRAVQVASATAVHLAVGAAFALAGFLAASGLHVVGGI